MYLDVVMVIVLHNCLQYALHIELQTYEQNVC